MSFTTSREQKLHDAISKIVDTERVTVEIESQHGTAGIVTVATLQHCITKQVAYVAVLAERLETSTEQGLSGIVEDAILHKAKYFLNDEVLASAVRWAEIREALTATGGQQ